ncbi:MAG TPA: J domain-containing protein [Kofleriaceae bacterium]|nr:J domain-containing protein [Kofleriaceae bacterium]
MADGALSIKLRCASWQQLATIYKRDLSQGTMFLKASTPPAIGTSVKIELSLPSATVISLTGMVHTHLQDPQRGAGVELKLDPIAAGTVWLIESALASEHKRQATPFMGVPVVGTPHAHQMTSMIPTIPEIAEAADVAAAEQDLIKALVSEAESLKKLNPFLVLGVGYEATDGEVRAAFGELTKRYHPDRFARYESLELRQVAAEIFILIRDAYRRLADAAARASLLASLGKQPAAPRAVPAPPRVTQAIPPPRMTQRLSVSQVGKPPTKPPPTTSSSSASGLPAPATPPTGSTQAIPPVAIPPLAIPPPVAIPSPPPLPSPPLAGVPPIPPPRSPSRAPASRPPAEVRKVPRAATADPSPPAIDPRSPRPASGGSPVVPPGSHAAHAAPSSAHSSAHSGASPVVPPADPARIAAKRAATEPGGPLAHPLSERRTRASQGPATEPVDVSALEELLDQGKLDEASTGYKLMAKKHPSDRSVRAGVEVCEGMRALAGRDRLEAAQRFEAALEIDPSNERAARELAEMRRQATNERKGLLSRLMGKKEP